MLEFEQKVFNIINENEIFENLKKYVNFIEQKNKVMNLTGFSQDILWRDGIYESILFFNSFKYDYNENSKFLDIGSGAGFPIIPFAILNPKYNITIVESNKKRVVFLEQVKEKLNLNKINIIWSRIEDHHNKYDIITARALTSSSNLAKYSNVLLKQDGIAFFIKGPKINQEIEEQEFLNNIKFLKLKYEILNMTNIEYKDITILKIYK